MHPGWRFRIRQDPLRGVWGIGPTVCSAAAVVAQATVAQVRTEFASLLPNAPWHADNQVRDYAGRALLARLVEPGRPVRIVINFWGVT